MAFPRFISLTRVALALLTIAGAAGAQAPERVKPPGFSMISANVEQLSANGNSSTGFGGSYGSVSSVILYGADVAFFNEFGSTSMSALSYLGYGLGPYRNAATPASSSSRFVAFGPVVGLYGTASDAGSSYDPFAGGALMAPLGGRLMTKFTSGFVFYDGGHSFYLNIGFGIRF